MEDVVVRTLTWRLVTFLFLLYIVAYLDRINLGFAALQMQQQLGFTDAVYGFGAGVFFAGYFLFQVPSNLVLVRTGARRWIMLIMIAWGLLSVATVFASGPRSYVALRFLLGAAEAGFYPGVIVYLTHWFPLRDRTKALAWFFIGTPLAAIIGPPISERVMSIGTDAVDSIQIDELTVLDSETFTDF